MDATVAERKPPGARRGPRAARAKPPADRVTQYAHDVISGHIVAGPHVRDACKRHLRDLEDGPKRGLVWDVVAAADRLAFFEEVLCLNGGDYEGKPFILLPWQAFVVGSLEGWRRADTGVRRFRVAYVETAKGSGKSPLAAGIGLAGLMIDGEARAEVYAAATKRDQAMVLFRDAVAMYQQSPELLKRLTPSGMRESVWNLGYAATGSFFRAISAEDGQSGPRPHVALIDEIHEHKTQTVVEMMRAGTKSRRQALIFMITNSGAGKVTPCAVYHDYACQVAGGVRLDDAFFGYVCALDDGDDPLRDEACWPKANPSLQHAELPGVQYLRDQVTEALGMPAKEAIVRRLNFCQWTEAQAPWLSAHVWEPCRADFSAEQLRGRRAYAGLDLSSTTDLTGFVLLVEPLEPAEPWSILPYCWLPADDLWQREQRDRAPYVAWRDAGYLEVTPGRAISKLFVLQRVAQLCAMFEVLNMSYDRWRMEDLLQLSAEHGIPLPPLLPFGQGYKDMSPAIDKFETALLNRQLRHNGHPVLTSCAANAVADLDPAGNRKLNKLRAIGRIDLIVAAVMAYAAVQQPPDATPFWDLNAL